MKFYRKHSQKHSITSARPCLSDRAWTPQIGAASCAGKDQRFHVKPTFGFRDSHKNDIRPAWKDFITFKKRIPGIQWEQEIWFSPNF